MDVKGILQNQAEDLLDIEIDGLEEEVNTGDYSSLYRNDCNDLIRQIRNARKSQISTKLDQADGISACAPQAAPLAEHRSLSPFNNVPVPKRTDSEVVAHDLAAMRKMPNWKTQFKAYLAQSKIIDEDFCDKHFELFTRDEMSILLETRSFGEAFLEKYFQSLNHEKIARNQSFSEEFFIEHFSELDHNVVLHSGRNEWAKPESMSSQLNVFLRLKGVRL